MDAKVHRILAELARFGLVGVLGFLVDAGTLYVGVAIGLNLYEGRLISYLIAATTTWVFNRSFTFRRRDPVSFGEWFRFLMANAVGGSVNLATYALLVAISLSIARAPILAVAAGSIAGLLINFGLSRRLVFKERSSG